ncbi:MAG: polysaccharide deacetylase family protein [Turicibacter sp.]
MKKQKRSNLYLFITSILIVTLILSGMGIYTSLINKYTSSAISKTNTPTVPTDTSISGENNPSTQPVVSTNKVVYLTFDDGPSDYTKDIVDILNEYNVPATFYFIGKNIYGKESEVAYVATNGHTVGLHSMSHDRSLIYSEDDTMAFVNELISVQEYLEPIIGFPTYSTRAPYGTNHMPIETFENAGNSGFKFWDWSIDTNDWREETTSKSIMEYLNNYPLENREIVLEHELPITLDVLPSIIQFFKDQGYSFKSHNLEEHFPYNFHRDDRY